MKNMLGLIKRNLVMAAVAGLRRAGRLLLEMCCGVSSLTLFFRCRVKYMAPELGLGSSHVTVVMR